MISKILWAIAGLGVATAILAYGLSAPESATVAAVEKPVAEIGDTPDWWDWEEIPLEIRQDLAREFTELMDIVPVYQIWDEYAVNEVRAEDKYQGKNIRITGYVTRVSSGGVDLETGELWTQARLHGFSREELIVLNSGQTLTAICYFKGRSWMGSFQFENCRYQLSDVDTREIYVAVGEWQPLGKKDSEPDILAGRGDPEPVQREVLVLRSPPITTIT